MSEGGGGWVNGIMEWIRKELFGGMGRERCVRDMGGKLGEKVEWELIKVVEWMRGGMSSVMEEGMGVGKKVIEDMKKGFGENVKKGLLKMVKRMRNGMLDMVEKLVRMMGEGVGGEGGKEKMDEGGECMVIESDENGCGNVREREEGERGGEGKMDGERVSGIGCGGCWDEKNMSNEGRCEVKGGYGCMGGGSVGGGMG